MSLSTHFILLAIGSRGDVDPLKWIGLELARHGHHVLFLTLPAFAKEFARLGLQSLASPPDLNFSLHPKGRFRPLRLFSRSLDDWVRGRGTSRRRNEWLLEQIESRHVSGKTVVVGRVGMFAGRLARETVDVRLATIHHSPASMRSRTDSFRFFPQSGSRLARSANHLMWRGMDAIVGAVLLPSLNRLRKSRGLPRIRKIFDGWAASPDLNLGLFPAWYAAPQSDWPAHARLAGFPAPPTDGSLPEPVLRFLQAGEPPLLVTIGAHEDPGGKLERTVEQLVSRGEFRCIFLGRRSSQDPSSGLLHCEYVPLAQLLPHCRAIVHHGGVGTMSAAFRAGTPQLVFPILGDQWDQARRAVKLGCAKIIRLRQLEKTLLRALAEIETDPGVRAACRAVRAQAVREDGVKTGANCLEALAGRMSGVEQAERSCSRPLIEVR